MDFIFILHYQWNFPPQVYAAETTFNKSFLCTQYSKIIPTKMSYMYISFKMIFLQMIISQSPESGSPQVSLNSNFLGRATTITWNYCLLSPGMCYKNIIQQSFSQYTIGLLVGGGGFLLIWLLFSGTSLFKELIEIYYILFCSPPVDESIWLLKMVSL